MSINSPSDVPNRRSCDPVQYINRDDEQRSPESGMALCLSGGGYRAMLFHLGSIWRLYETGILASLNRISSVSGGSITAGVLALAWDSLLKDASPKRNRFETEVVTPIRNFARRTIDARAIIGGMLLPGTISKRVQANYRKYLFGDATLQDLPDNPRFVINATNVQSGVLWRFSKPYMRDYRVGEVVKPTVPIALAVAASSAFPPFLSPLVMKLNPGDFTPNSGEDLQREPFTKRVILTDGGVYDNLGLETAWKRYETILVSDAGGGFEPKEKPNKNWACHSYRVLNIIDNQVRSLRKRLLIESYLNGTRKGTYWGIRTNIANYELADPLPCPFDNTIKIAETPTRLKCLDDNLQEKLINWGYAVCDAAIRKYVDPGFVRPNDFPFPAAAV